MGSDIEGENLYLITNALKKKKKINSKFKIREYKRSLRKNIKTQISSPISSVSILFYLVRLLIVLLDNYSRRVLLSLHKIFKKLFLNRIYGVDDDAYKQSHS